MLDILAPFAATPRRCCNSLGSPWRVPPCRHTHSLRPLVWFRDVSPRDDIVPLRHPGSGSIWSESYGRGKSVNRDERERLGKGDQQPHHLLASHQPVAKTTSSSTLCVKARVIGACPTPYRTSHPPSSNTIPPQTLVRLADPMRLSPKVEAGMLALTSSPHLFFGSRQDPFIVRQVCPSRPHAGQTHTFPTRQDCKTEGTWEGTRLAS